MVRRIQKTLDWEVFVRYLAGATVVYVVGTALFRHWEAASRSLPHVN